MARTRITRDGTDGYLVAPGDLEGFIAAVDRVLADPVHARKMGEAGRARASDVFSEDRFYTRLMTIYRDVIAEGAPR